MEDKVANSELESRGRSFLYGLRESFGDSLNQGGLIARPRTDGLGDVTVRAVAHDTGNIHSTEAVVDIARENQMARLAISTAEPTIGAKRMESDIEATTSVVIDGTKEIIEPDQALREVEAAFDKGEFEAYAHVG